MQEAGWACFEKANPSYFIFQALSFHDEAKVYQGSSTDSHDPPGRYVRWIFTVLSYIEIAIITIRSR